MSIKSVFLAGLMAIVACGAARAADTASGKVLAQNLCSNCHIVGPDQARQPVIAGIPSFMAIAAKEGQTPERVAGFIIIPHPPMPEIQLTKIEITNLVAYIMSLKEEK